MAGLGELLTLLKPMRVRAGLTQAQVADALGKPGKPGVTVVSRLELGKFASPSLRLVLDYLRACRATPEDAAQLLGRYLSQPLDVPERRTRGRPRGPRQVKEDPTVLALRQEAAVWILRQIVEHMLRHELNQLGAPRFQPIRRDAVQFGRRVFKTLLATRDRTEAVRERRLGRSRATAVRHSMLPDLLHFVEDKVAELFRDMEKEGELDWLPDEERARSVMLRSSRRRLKTDWRMCLEEYLAEQQKEHDEYRKLAGPVFSAAEQLLVSAGATGHQIGNYRGFITNFLNIARTTRPGSRERSAKLEESLSVGTRRWHDPALLRRLAAFVFERWDAAKPLASI